MYVKLVIGAAANPLQCIRDIARLITSVAPSISDLSGQGFSTTSSIVIDDTPAGWTYVGSNKATDRPTIGGGAADATWVAGTNSNWAFRAPCLNPAQANKFAILTHNITNTAPSGNYFGLTGAVSVSSLGVATSEGPRIFSSSSTALFLAPNLTTAAATTIHLIATPRHITIIQEGRGMHAVWETTSTPIHDRLLTAPFVQYSHGQASSTSATPLSVIATIAAPSGTATNATVTGTVFSVTDVNTGTYFGTSDASVGTTHNLFNLFQHYANSRANAIDQAGNPRYQISPVWLHMSNLGYPAQYVTGVVPIYWCRAGLGISGDTVNIGGENYYYFHTGAYGTSSYGVLLKLN
jgi:hypothetical protein